MVGACYAKKSFPNFNFPVLCPVPRLGLVRADKPLGPLHWFQRICRKPLSVLLTVAGVPLPAAGSPRKEAGRSPPSRPRRGSFALSTPRGRVGDTLLWS